METNTASEIEFSLHRARRRSDPTDADRVPRLTRVLALAISFQDMIARGEARTFRELASRAGVTAERLGQVMKLNWLAPVIQQEILSLRSSGGRYPITEYAVRGIAAKWSWSEQLTMWTALKRDLRIEASQETE